LRPAQGRLPQVRPVPDLPARDGPPGRAARRDQVELVKPHHPPPSEVQRGLETRREGTHTMTMTDPIADMLTRLRNANQAYHDSVSMPYSKLKQGVAEILKQEGYITSFEVQALEGVVGKTLEIQLKYGRSRERSIAGVRRISKPGLRVYSKHTALPKVVGGLGVAIISTSQGLLTDRQANKKGVGGEVLAYVW